MWAWGRHHSGKMLTEAMAAAVLCGSYVVTIGAHHFIRLLTLTLAIATLHLVALAMTRVLVVWSRSKVGRVSVKDSRTFSPFGANEFVGRKPFEALEPFGEVISQ